MNGILLADETGWIVQNWPLGYESNHKEFWPYVQRRYFDFCGYCMRRGYKPAKPRVRVRSN